MAAPLAVRRVPPQPSAIRARGRKIHVRLPVALAVARAAVAGGDRHRDAERRGVLQRGLHGIARRTGPAVLGAAPADRHHRRVVGGVVRGLRDRLVESLVGVGCEVHDDGRAGRERADHLDVEHHFVVGVRRRVCWLRRRPRPRSPWAAGRSRGSAKYCARSLVLKPPPSSMIATVSPLPSVAAGKPYSCAELRAACSWRSVPRWVVRECARATGRRSSPSTAITSAAAPAHGRSRRRVRVRRRADSGRACTAKARSSACGVPRRCSTRRCAVGAGLAQSVPPGEAPQALEVGRVCAALPAEFGARPAWRLAARKRCAAARRAGAAAPA